MMRVDRRCSAIALVLTTVAIVPARAQQPRDHRIEVSLGAGVFGPGSLGTRDADLRANGSVAQPYRLFSTRTRLRGAPALEARLGFWMSRRISVEGRFGYSRPELRTSVSADAEGAAAVTVVERIDQFAIDGGINVHIDEWRLAGFTPFATAGAGYLRQLHAGRALVEQGHSYFAGGGITRPLVRRTRHTINTIDLRGDVRLDLLAGGVGPDHRVSPHASATAGVAFGF
jgi:hypothetical protein